MKDSKFFAAAMLSALLCVDVHGAPEAVKVSDFGYDPADSTEFIKKALASGAKKVILDRQTGPWHTLPLKMPSNIEFILEPGVELVAKRGEFHGKRDFLMELNAVSNVTIRGGAGSAFRMWKYDYQKPPYVHSEWRYALRIARCSNVLVEDLKFLQSGGDGIGVSGENITIRRCVCDDNHRQGMSVFSVRNLLVEDTVFSNTRGTAPQAGVDIEPDVSRENLKNIVFRNCTSFGNAGNGFEVYLIQLNRKSGPIDITFENCRSWGNGKNDTTVSCSAKPGVEPVGGLVRYVNCVFGPSVGRCGNFSNLTDGAVDVSLEGCVFFNNAAAVARPAVGVSVSRPSLGVPDGFAFRNLTVFQPLTNAWFACFGAGAGDPSKRVSGDVRVVDGNGGERREKIDADWIVRNIPVFDGGRALPERRSFAATERLKVHDDRPGELESLASVALSSPAEVVFFADKAGPCRFVMRQIPDRQRKVKRPLTVVAVEEGVMRKAVKLPAPDVVSTEVVFDAPKRGLYRMGMSRWAAKLLIEKASVPVALDFSQVQRRVSSVGVAEFSLGVPFDGTESTIMVSGAHGAAYAAEMRSAGGKVRESASLPGGIFVAHGEKGDAPEIRVLNVKLPESGKPRVFTLDVYGAPPYMFMTKEKFWK